jgi:hypothetical protein
MMAIGKDEVVEVLWDFRIRSIRFSAGPIDVNVDEYWRVADFVKEGAIRIRLTTGTNMYLPKINELRLRDGDSRNDFNIRSGILHECTHVIADINKARVTRLHDEATAYIAQLAFLKLLDPSYEAPAIRGVPLYDLTRMGLSLVAKYGLGQPAGFCATISASDIVDLGRLVQRHPEYSHVKDEEQLTADGVALTKQQAAAHAMQLAVRQVDKTKYENWLLVTMKLAQTSGGVEKSSAYAQLRQHFFMVYQPVATVLLHRFSAIKRGDPLSERFYRFNAQEKYELLGDLRVPKPPG